MTDKVTLLIEIPDFLKILNFHAFYTKNVLIIFGNKFETRNFFGNYSKEKCNYKINLKFSFKKLVKMCFIQKF